MTDEFGSEPGGVHRLEQINPGVDAHFVQHVDDVFGGDVARGAGGEGAAAKAGEGTELKYKFALSYYKLTINGETLIEIDVVNMVETVNGTDRLAEVRAALGV